MATTSISAVFDVDPDALFSTLIDVDRLPEWNTAITKVLDRPDALEPGTEWLVEMHALAQHWPSRSKVQVIDPLARRFSYRSCTDDGNPSYADWSWTIDAEGDASRVTVAWKLHPKTFWRRVLLARIRARSLARAEIPNSLAALAAAARRSPAPTDAEN